MSSVSEGRYTMYHQQQTNSVPTAYDYSAYAHQSYDSTHYPTNGVRTVPRPAESQGSPVPPTESFVASAQPYQVYGHPHYGAASQPTHSQWSATNHTQQPQARPPQQQQSQQHQPQHSPLQPPHQPAPSAQPQPQPPPQQHTSQQQQQQQHAHWQSQSFGSVSASYAPAQVPPPVSAPNATPPTVYKRPPAPQQQGPPPTDHRVPQSPLISVSPRVVSVGPSQAAVSSQRVEREAVSTPALPAAAPPTDGPPSLDFAKLMDSCRLIIDASAALGVPVTPNRAPPAETIERMLGSASFAVQMLTASSYAVLDQSPTEHPRVPLGGDDSNSSRKRGKHHEAANTDGQVCLGCKATTTPEWRRGPMGPRTLCNACGLVYAKMIKKRSRDVGQNDRNAAAGDMESGEDSSDEGTLSHRSGG